jgi:branched-chain amino acid transport system substrate-binding protein
LRRQALAGEILLIRRGQAACAICAGNETARGAADGGNKTQREDNMRYRRAAFAAIGLLALIGGAASRAAEPIRIGFSMSLTGPYAVSGKQALIAMKLWESDINAKGGLLHRPVELKYYDDQSNQANVPGIYTKLLDIDHVDLIVGPYGTVMTAPALPVAMAHHMVVVSFVALNVNLRFHYDRYFSPTPLGANPIKDFSAGFFHAAMEAKPKPKTLAIVAADQEFATQNTAGARENAKEAGLRIVYDQKYPPTTTDFAPIIQAVRAANPDIVYAASYPPDSVGLVRAINEANYRPEVFGGAMVGLTATPLEMQLGPQLNGIVTFAAWEPLKTMMYPGVQHMLERYAQQAKAEGADPLGYAFAPAAYAYIQVLGEAVEGAGTLDQGKIAQYMHTHSFDTIDGKYSFDHDGNAKEDRLLQVQFHGITGHGLDQFSGPEHYTILWPTELRTGSLIYPYAKAAGANGVATK